MNTSNHREDERLMQELAEQAERGRLPATGDAQVDQYRVVVRALRQPLPLGLPDDFSARVMQRIHVREQRSAREDLIVALVLMALAMLGLALAYPYLLDGIAQLRGHVPMADGLAAQVQQTVARVPWSMLGVAGIGIGAALTFERWLGRSSAPLA